MIFHDLPCVFFLCQKKPGAALKPWAVNFPAPFQDGGRDGLVVVGGVTPLSLAGWFQKIPSLGVAPF